MLQKKIGLLSVIVLLLALAACSAAPAAQASNGAAGQTAAGTPQPGQGQVNTETKLIIGTFRLEGTDQAVTKDQAVQLLPLWKAMKTLTSSQTSSADEINALYKQIQDTMTADQNKAIDGMQITFQSMGEEMAKLGITPVAGGFGGSGTPSPSQLATRQARIAQGGGNFTFGGGRDGGAGGQGFPPGGGTGGGQGFNPNGGQTGQNNGTVATAVAGRGGRGRTNPALLDALIKLLTERAG